MPRLTQSIPLRGGLNLDGNPATTRPGQLLLAQNVDPDRAGYSRVSGFCRYDGRPTPLDAAYYVIKIRAATVALTANTQLTATIALGDLGNERITFRLLRPCEVGDTTLIIHDIKKLGLWILGLQFDDDSKTFRIVSTSMPDKRGVVDNALDNTLMKEAAKFNFDAIEPSPPGNTITSENWNRILGLFAYQDELFAFKRENNADNPYTSVVALSRATPTGWEQITLPYVAHFTSGVREINVGDYLIQSSRFTPNLSTLPRVAYVEVTSGSWASTTAAGTLILHQEGATTLNFPKTVMYRNQAGATTAVAVLTNVPKRFSISVITNSLESQRDQERFATAVVDFGFGERVYVAHPRMRPFVFYQQDAQWVAVSLSAIRPLQGKYPSTVAAHKNHLFFGYPSGQLIHSSIGDPMTYETVTGAAQIALSDSITALQTSGYDVLIVSGRRSLAYLQGTSAADWQLKTASGMRGARPFTMPSRQIPLLASAEGIYIIQATDRFGNLSVIKVSEAIESLFAGSRLTAGVTSQDIVGATYEINTEFYRLFLKDGRGFTLRMSTERSGLVPQWTTFDLGIPVEHVYQTIDTNGAQKVFFASQGKVYQWGVDFGFDDQAIKATMRLTWTAGRNPAQNNRYHHVDVLGTAGEDCLISVNAEFAYGANLPTPLEDAGTIAGASGYWDIGKWGDMLWSTPAHGRVRGYLDGQGTNVSILIVSTEPVREGAVVHSAPFTIHSVDVLYSPRSLVKAS